MEKKQVSLSVVVLLCAAMAAAAGGIGYWMSQANKPKSAPAPDIAVAKAEPIAPAASALVQPEMTNDDWDDLIGGADAEPTSQPFDPEDLEERRQRFESMTTEQRQMLRKAMFAAMSKIDGLEEIGEGIREGKIDPRQFKIDMPAIADRMEIHAETMDQAAMEEEVTRTLQEVVDQARGQMK